MKSVLLFTIFPVLLIAQTLRVETGTYTGNGTSQSVTGLGFTPKFVMIKGNTTQTGAFRTSAHTTNLSSQTTNANDLTTAITSIDANGFSVGASATVNGNTLAYYWVAIDGDNVVTGTGAGSGSGATVSIGQSFTPDVIIAKCGGGTKYPYIWTSAHTDPASSPLTIADQNNLGIHAVSAGQFTVGINIDVESETYWWVAINADVNSLDVNKFTGNGLDNRDITLGVAWTPEIVIAKNAAFAATGIWRITEVAGDNGLRFDNSGFLSNTIQSIGAGTFQVGSNSAVNGNGNTVYYVALRNSAIILPQNLKVNGFPKPFTRGFPKPFK